MKLNLWVPRHFADAIPARNQNKRDAFVVVVVVVSTGRYPGKWNLSVESLIKSLTA